MSRVKDLTGNKYGRLTVVSRNGSSKGSKNALWLCKCECGNEVTIPSNRLNSGRVTLSCGCLKADVNAQKVKSYCTYDLETCEYGIGYTHNGCKFYFDKEDYDLLKEYCWYQSDGYLVANDLKNNNPNKKISMHRLLMNFPTDMVVDHKDKNRFNNRKENLRVSTIAENSYNKSLNSLNKSGVTGVSYIDGRWVAYIQKDRQQYKKRFDNFEKAIKWRLSKELELFGSYSPNSLETLNKIKIYESEE